MRAGCAPWCLLAWAKPRLRTMCCKRLPYAAVEKGHQLRDPASAAPWLYRLAVMAALQYRRRQGRRRKLLDRFAERSRLEDGETRELDPLDWLLADERKAMIRKALRACRNATRKSCCSSTPRTGPIANWQSIWD